MIRIGSIVWGVRDIPRAVEFWSAALGYGPLYEPDVDWALLAPTTGTGTGTGTGPRLALKLVGTEANPSPRHHLDLYADDQGAEADRLRGLGASDVEWEYEESADYLVLADPDGNRFCVVAAGESAAGDAAAH
ncbi:VOC family protein [Leifsonia sp. TF02-11]|uniref:VOC family protein n=1 Tax=Leifsonia sp. TF02-11 TaxID=2815212 RepID=UPI001AA0FA9E|nr:VOC family protein [Leifsonia sp. TF02-11]MBO1740003.1 VOC family protein [Leifsonia sp. TF02-11]